MSFLDEIFGTDGRKHKDEGIWNWVKNQRIKRKLKKAEQAALHTMTPAAATTTFSSASSATGGHTHNHHYHQHHHLESTQHTRSRSVSSAASTSHASFYCSPRSPTSTFTPSTAPTTAYSSPRGSLYFRRPASVNSTATTAVGSVTPPMDVSSPKTHRLPYTHSRQRAQSTFTLPAVAAESSLPKRSASSRQQRSQHSDDYYQSHNLHSHHIHDYYDDDEGHIRRSASSRSAPTYYYSQSGNQCSQHSQHSQQQLVEDDDYANLCDIDSLSISGQSSSYNSSSGSISSSNKGKGVQRDQEETIDEITEIDGCSGIAAGSDLSSPTSTSPSRRRSMDTAMDNPILAAVNQTLQASSRAIEAIPGSEIVINYIKNSYQNDPFRVVLELGLAVFAVKYMLSKKYRIDPSHIKLTEKEIDELVAEWQPEPLVQPLSDIQRMELEKTQVIAGHQGPKPKMLSSGKNLLNLASTNFLGYINNEDIKEKAIETLRNYGVGSCGPPGFYGTLDVHINLEKDIARFLGTEKAIIYSQNFSTISSVIAAFSKRGDIIVADDGCNFAIQKGTQISRSNIKWFKHNDMADLERVLESIKKETTTSKKRPLTRRFIVTEGLFQNYGDIAPLDKIMELKEKYKYRVILDECNSFGLLGKNGRGLTEVFNISPKRVDMIIGSMANALSGTGGFCAGSKEVVEHQRLSGQAFVFSAAMPAMLAVCASEAIKILETPEKGNKLLKDMSDNAAAFRNVVVSAPQAIEVSSDVGSPILHLRFPKNALSAAGITTRDDEKYLLQEIVDEVAVKDGLLITRAKYVESQEMFLPRPSIRISICATHARKDVEKAAQAIKASFVKAISKRK
ncbi:serine palmitoyltransferase component [Linnemannia schmuckeri]|uniref:serine C-palmitoyltransferase n=1 Tax=Linnemannia schmuckeri TaxID=64567 RepID=A0A9P5S0E9_9FUNG|nr:serine palmitoyltransferase component [Linnemannia schmuckeri]